MAKKSGTYRFTAAGQSVARFMSRNRVSTDALNAYFSPSWTAFQAERGRDFSVIVDGVST